MNELTKIAKHYIQKWFNYTLYPSQRKILEFFFNKSRKATIKATTRYGKSQVVALGSIMYAIFNDNKKIGIFAPTNDKTRIIMGYIQDALASSKEMESIVDIDIMGLTRLERLKKEVSKRKITFRNGSSIQVISADIKGKGFSAMGWGFDLTIIDESAEIPDEVYNKIYRILVENIDSKIIELGNPWHLNHFYNHFYDDSWDKFSINWETAVKEGRMRTEDVEDQKKNLTSLEFDVLFNANFPENIENSIFKSEYLKLATRKKEFTSYDNILIGGDIAAGGKDYTVITVIGEKDNEFSFLEFKVIDTNDTMAVTGIIQNIADKYKNPKIQIDAIGFGKGVVDRLRENKYSAYQYISGNSAIDKTRFYNRKSEDLFGLANIIQQGRLWNLPADSIYILELKKYTSEVRSDRLIKSIDPEDKSPDYADSLLIAMSKQRSVSIGYIDI